MQYPTITWDPLCGTPVHMEMETMNAHLCLVVLTAQLPMAAVQDDWQVRLRLVGEPSFFWAPHLAPQPGYCIDQHVFRCPALVASDQEGMIAVMPDLDVLKDAKNRWYMDLDAPNVYLPWGFLTVKCPNMSCSAKSLARCLNRGPSVLPSGFTPARIKKISLILSARCFAGIGIPWANPCFQPASPLMDH